MDAPVNIRRIMERYHDHIWRLKCKVMTGRISGCVYQETVAAMRYEAIREGLRERDFEDVLNDVERSINYYKPQVFVAPFD